MKYRTPLKKSEVVNAIVSWTEKIISEYRDAINDPSLPAFLRSRMEGKSIAMDELLYKVKIYQD